MFGRKKQPQMYIPPELQAYYNTEIQAQRKANKRKIIVPIIALIMVVAIGVAVGLFLSNDRSDPFETTPQPNQSQEVKAPDTAADAPSPTNPEATEGTVQAP